MALEAIQFDAINRRKRNACCTNSGGLVYCIIACAYEVPSHNPHDSDDNLLSKG